MTMAPTSSRPAFWEMQRQPFEKSNKIAQRNECLLTRVWLLDKGSLPDHWNLYNTYGQEQLRHEVSSHWNAWKESYSNNPYAPWVWALKVYLWRFPLDTEFLDTLRQEMGPFWLLHARHSDADWKWLYSMRDTMSMAAMVMILGMLPAHSTGEALAVRIPPSFEGYTASDLANGINYFKLTLSHPSMGLLARYGNVLLHEKAHFYPRWRAMLLCLHNSLWTLRNGNEKKKTTNSVAQLILVCSCEWLRLTPRTLWNGFELAWTEFAKSKMCLSLVDWDTMVQKFSASKDWRTRLRETANSNQRNVILV